MFLQSLWLDNFRNYRKTSLNFKEKNLFYGPNSSGKTNLLEAIYFLAYNLPFKESDVKNLINKQSTQAIIKAFLIDNDEKKELLVSLNLKSQSDYSKTLLINKKKKTVKNFIGQLKVVYFLPSDIELINSSPAQKRKYFDKLISQIDKLYYSISNQLDKIIKARNKILEGILRKKSKKEEILFWDQKLIDYGSFIFYRRQKIVNFLNQIINPIYQKLDNSQNKLSINWESFLPFNKFNNLELIKKEYRIKLNKIKNKEIEKGYSLLGPHRDNYEFLINKQKVNAYYSRSEFRKSILALKFSEGFLIQKTTGKKPIFLLDDITSELDEENKHYLFAFLKNYLKKEGQVFITTTSKKQLNKEFLKDSLIFKIEKGKICLSP